MAISKSQKVEMLKRMLLIRRFEEEVEVMLNKGMVPGFVHPSIGQEGVAVGVCTSLEQGDFITSTHRGHGHLIAKGGDVRYMMAEVLGKKEGYCHGKGGSMHIMDIGLGILGANGIVGGGLPIAVGAGLACKLKGEGRVVASFFGDGASNIGAFHESLNMASIWRLPILFVCENNRYAVSTKQENAQNIADIAQRASGYGMPGKVVDGNDVEQVFEAAQEAVKIIREGKGPSLLECKTYRLRGHYLGDPDHYRKEEEVRQWKANCPITRFKKVMVEKSLMDVKAIEALEAQVREEIKEAVAFAHQAPFPQGQEALQDVWA